MESLVVVIPLDRCRYRSKAHTTDPGAAARVAMCRWKRSRGHGRALARHYPRTNGSQPPYGARTRSLVRSFRSSGSSPEGAPRGPRCHGRLWPLDAGGGDRGDMALVGSAAAADHDQMRQSAHQAPALRPELLGVAVVQLLGLVQFGVTL